MEYVILIIINFVVCGIYTEIQITRAHKRLTAVAYSCDEQIAHLNGRIAQLERDHYGTNYFGEDY